MALIRLILYFFLALIIIRFVRLIMRYWSSSKPSINDLHEEHKNVNQDFRDIEEAEFREINFDDEEEKNQDR